MAKLLILIIFVKKLLIFRVFYGEMYPLNTPSSHNFFKKTLEKKIFLPS